MKTSWSAEFSIFEDMPIVLVGVVELLVGLVGITGWKKKRHIKTELIFSVLQVTMKSMCIILGILTSFFGLAVFSHYWSFFQKGVYRNTVLRKSSRLVMKETDKRPVKLI